MILNQERFPIIILYILILFVCCACNNQNLIEEKNSYDNCIQKATKYNTEQQFDSAFYYFNKAKLVCNDNETEKKNYCLFYIAEIEQQQSDFSGSEVTAIEALENNNQSLYLPNIYNQLGIAYSEQNDFENAIKYYNKSYIVTKDLLYRAIIKNNIAVVYLKNSQYLNAINTLSPLLQNRTLIDNPTEYAKVIDNLGYAYFKNNNPKALTFLNKALQIRETQKISYELIASYMHLAEYYEITKPNLAQKFAELGNVNAIKSNSVDDRIRVLKFLIKNSLGTLSKKYALQQIQLSDSINKVRQKNKTQFAKIKYDSTKALQESQNQKTQKLFFLCLLIITLLSGYFVFKTIRKRSREKLKTISYETETRISKNLHDELANHIFHTITFAQTQDLLTVDKKESLLNELDKIYHKIRDFSKQNNPIDTGEKFQENLLEMLSDFNTEKLKVIIKNDFIDWKHIQLEKKIAIHRVLLELMVNMKKHSQCTFVILKFGVNNNVVTIDYSDNGVGDPQKLFLKKGLQNTENRIKAIKGSVIFDAETNQGFKLKISFPK